MKTHKPIHENTYIYIYVCVCVCVCVWLMAYKGEQGNQQQHAGQHQGPAAAR